MNLEMKKYTWKKSEKNFFCKIRLLRKIIKMTFKEYATILNKKLVGGKNNV